MIQLQTGLSGLRLFYLIASLPIWINMSESVIDLRDLQFRVGMHRDMKAYQQVYKHFYQPLIQFATAMVDSKEVAEELYSDLLLKVWNMTDRLTTIDNLKVYLYRSIKNASLNYLQQQERRPVVSLEVQPVEKPQVAFMGDDVLKKEFQVRLQKAIAALPPKGRMVYLLIKEEGMSYKQVADILSISPNTVEGHMTTALKRITASLKAYFNHGSSSQL